MDLYNEPLNLSVRSKPVAVVPPSSSTKNYDCSENRTATPSNFHSEMSQDGSTSDTQNTTENIKTVMHQQYNSSSSNNNVDNIASAVRNVSEPSLLNLAASNGNSPSAPMLSLSKKIKSNLVDNNSDEEEEEDSDSRNTSPASVPYQKSAISAILTAYMENFHEHQQSLDAAKLHLQQYLKLTNQYLQKYAELVPSSDTSGQSSHHHNAVGSNNNNNNNNNPCGNDTINNIIHTNILTNKITTNNLISIINKLLEQNIVSEFYFKHATAFQEQQKLRQDICHDELDYDGPTNTSSSGGMMGGGMSSASIALMGNGTSNSGGGGMMTAGGMLGGMLLDHLSLGNNNANNNGASNNARHDRHSVMLSDNNSSCSSSLMSTTNAVLGGIGGLTAPLFMNQSHANKLKTMKNLAMIARERLIFPFLFLTVLHPLWKTSISFFILTLIDTDTHIL